MNFRSSHILFSTRVLIITVAYWALLGVLKEISIAMFDVLVRAPAHDLGFRPEIRDWFQIDVLFFIILIVGSYVIAAKLKLHDNFLVELVTLGLMALAPLIWHSFCYFVRPKCSINGWCFLAVDPYLVSPFGAVGASIGWVSTIIMLPIMVISYRLLFGSWPRYSLRCLIAFIALLSSLIMLSIPYLRLFDTMEWV